jgi:protein SCO1/2
MRGTFVGVILALIILILASGCNSSLPSDVDYSVSDFSLIERGGETVQRDDLHGKIWVAAFIFTRCAGPCSQVSGAMAHLQHDLAGTKGIKLVSFTVDPEYDRPEVLRIYAERFKADPRNWLFLTGNRDEIHKLAVESFHLGVVKNEGPDVKPGFQVEHSTKLVLVDPEGRIRDYFDGTNPEELPRLERQISLLLWQHRLPALNAILNGLSAVLLILGYVSIRRFRIGLHKTCMLSALCVSILFLASYLYYHFVVKHGRPTPFTGEGWIRPVYFSILISHTALAAIAAPLAIFTAYKGLTAQFKKHKRIARVTLPIWLYVSITGVVVYWMLYHLYAAP